MRVWQNPVAFVLLVLSALGWAIYKAQYPGGVSIPFFLFFLILTLVSYYFGFVDKSINPFRFLSQAATFVFLLLAILMAHVFRMEDNAIEQIAKYIDVYPKITDVHLVPRVTSSELQHWVVKTTDSVSLVKRFYRDEAHLTNWQVQLREPVIVLVRDDYKLTISIAAQPREQITNIFYRLEMNE